MSILEQKGFIRINRTIKIDQDINGILHLAYNFIYYSKILIFIIFKESILLIKRQNIGKRQEIGYYRTLSQIISGLTEGILT